MTKINADVTSDHFLRKFSLPSIAFLSLTTPRVIVMYVLRSVYLRTKQPKQLQKRKVETWTSYFIK